jgi:hypothetical protein
MIANPKLIGLGDDTLGAVVAALQTGLGLGLVSYALIGFRNPAVRILSGAAGLAVIFWRLMIG